MTTAHALIHVPEPLISKRINTALDQFTIRTTRAGAIVAPRTHYVITLEADNHVRVEAKVIRKPQ